MTLRAQGRGWKSLAKELKVGVGTLYRINPRGSRTREKVFGTRQPLQSGLGKSTNQAFRAVDRASAGAINDLHRPKLL